MARAPTILATIGLILSLYALHVEHTQAAIEVAKESGMADMEMDEYKSLCDIEALGASCSATFALPEGRMLSFFGLVPEKSMLDVPNAFLGALYYSYVILYSLGITSSFFPLGLTFFANCMAMASSVFLAYKLLVLKKLCLLCWTTHVLNFSLIVYYGRMMFVRKKGENSKKKAA